MSGLGLGGLVSGVDTDGIIKKLMELENARITNQQMKRVILQAKQDAWSSVKSSLQDLRTKLDPLRMTSTFRSRAITLTDPTVATVTAGSSATMTTHSLMVTQLAQTHAVAGAMVLDATAALNVTGTLDINGKSVSIDVADNLYSLRDKINITADVGVNADVVQVMQGTDTYYRLVLTSQKQGTVGAVTMAGATLPVDLGFQDAGGNYLNEISVAQDATFRLDNVDYIKSTNVINDLLPKLSITLTKSGGASTNITVGQDTKPLADAASEWVAALNSTLALLKSQTEYNSDTKQAGTLNGDGLARNLQTALRGMLSNTVAGLPTDLNHLSQIGITTGAWGTQDYGKVLIDTDKLKSKLAEDPDGVAMVFGALRNNVALTTAGGYTDSPAAGVGGVFAAIDVLNGDSSSDRFGTAGGGWQSVGIPDPGDLGTAQYLDIYFDSNPAHPTTKTFDQVELSIPDTATYPAATAGLKDYTLQYYGEDDLWHEITSVIDHTGSYTIIDFDAVSARGLRLMVTATYGAGNPARVTELAINEVNNSAPLSMYAYLKSTLAINAGPLDTRNDSYLEQIDDMDEQISRMTEQMTKHEQALRDQFARMEAALAKMQSQGNMLMGQLMGSTKSR